MDGIFIAAAIHKHAIDASSKAADAQNRAKTVELDVASLQHRHDRALLACEAMWTLVSEKLGLTNEQLIQRMTELDLSDGKLDGKARKAPVTCPKCDRTMGAHWSVCLYCEQPLSPTPFV